MKMSMNYSKQMGMTLIEIMVSLTIGIFLSNGVLQIFETSKRSYNMNDQLSRLQEDGRRAMDILISDFRLIGYQGCADPATITPTIMADNAPTSNYWLTGVSGVEIDSNLVWTPALPSEIIPAAVVGDDPTGGTIDLGAVATANSDVIIAQFANPTGVTLMGNLTVTNANVQIVDNSAGFEAGDVLMISNCAEVDVFRATAVSQGGAGTTITHTNSSNSGNFLTGTYTANSQIMRFESNLYFVGPSGLDDGDAYLNSRGESISALYKVSANGELTELVQGVENLQLLYGQRLDTGNIRYVEADDATLDMSQVVSLKFAVLMATIDPVKIVDDTVTYDVNGTTVGPTGTSGVDVEYDPSDRRIRRVFSTAIHLRNKD